MSIQGLRLLTIHSTMLGPGATGRGFVHKWLMAKYFTPRNLSKTQLEAECIRMGLNHRREHANG